MAQLLNVGMMGGWFDSFFNIRTINLEHCPKIAIVPMKNSLNLHPVNFSTLEYYAGFA